MSNNKNGKLRNSISIIWLYFATSTTSMAASNFEFIGKTEWRTEDWSAESSDVLHQQWISTLEQKSPLYDEAFGFLPANLTNIVGGGNEYETRSDLAAQLNYKAPLFDTIRTRLSVAPTQTIYHVDQTRFLNIVLAGNVAYGTRENGWNFTGSYSQREVADHEFWYLETSAARFLYSKVMDTDGALPWRFSADATSLYKKITEFQNVDAIDTSLAFYGSQTREVLGDITLGYRLNIVRNLENTMLLNTATVLQPNPVTGITESIPRGAFILFDSRDYEYNMHQLVGEIRREITPSLSANINTALAFTQYVNPDSSARVRSRDDKRQNISFLLGSRIDYHFIEKFWWFASASYLVNVSSLATGYTTEDATKNSQVAENNRAIATVQSRTFGDFRRVIFSSGLFLYI